MIKTQHNIFVWNYRGASSKDFFRYCSQYVLKYKPKVLMIMETMCNPNKLNKSFTRTGFDDIISVENKGFACGIMVAWNKKLVTVELYEKKIQYIHMKVKIEEVKEWLFTLVYASANEEKSRVHWEDLNKISVSIDGA